MKFNKKMTVIFLNIYYAHKGSYDSLKKKNYYNSWNFSFPHNTYSEQQVLYKVGRTIVLGILIPASRVYPQTNL